VINFGTAPALLVSYTAPTSANMADAAGHLPRLIKWRPESGDGYETTALPDELVSIRKRSFCSRRRKDVTGN